MTTMELPPMPSPRSNPYSLSFDCDFTASCRWASIGLTSDRWRLGRGEPDVLLWLAATGTVTVPSNLFNNFNLNI